MKRRRYLIGLILSGAVLFSLLGFSASLFLTHHTPNDDLVSNEEADSLVDSSRQDSIDPATLSASVTETGECAASASESTNDALYDALSEEARTDRLARGMYYDINHDGQQEFLEIHFALRSRYYEVNYYQLQNHNANQESDDAFSWEYVTAFQYKQSDAYSLSAGVYQFDGKEYLGAYELYVVNNNQQANIELYPMDSETFLFPAFKISYSSEDNSMQYIVTEQTESTSSTYEIPYDDFNLRLNEIQTIQYGEDNGVGDWLVDLPSE